MKTATLFFKDMNGSNFCINEIPLSLTVSGLQELVGKDRAWDPSTLRFLFFGKELKAGGTSRIICVPRRCHDYRH